MIKMPSRTRFATKSPSSGESGFGRKATSKGVIAEVKSSATVVMPSQTDMNVEFGRRMYQGALSLVGATRRFWIRATVFERANLAREGGFRCEAAPGFVVAAPGAAAVLGADPTGMLQN